MGKFLFLFLVTKVAFLGAQTIDDLRFWTEEFPPYNFVENGVLKGKSTDFLAKVFQKLHAHQTISDVQVLPWARAYQLLLKTPDAVLFTMTKTPERTPLFYWVGPISRSNNVLIALKNRKLNLAGSLANSSLSFGAVRDDAGAQLLTSLGVPPSRLDLTTRADQSLKMLVAGRIDVFAFDETVAQWWMKRLGYPIADFQTVRVLARGEHYFALNKQTPLALVDLFRRAVNEVLAEKKSPQKQ
ncbi:MAG: transporter substrate-binding domain-containing protein [Spirochaetales bacterium]|nr:transporter substrate-binding domain-containing protein [Spirochaetales bacterium]